MTDTYKRVTDGVSIVPLQAPAPTDDASTFGAGLAQLGQVIQQGEQQSFQTKQRVAEIDLQTAKLTRERQQAAAVAMGAGAFADAQIAANKQLSELQQHAAPGAIGYGEAASKAINDHATAFLSALPDDPMVRERFAPELATWRARQTIAAHTYETEQFAKFQGQGYDHYQQTTANGILANPTEQSVADALTSTKQVLAGLHLSDGQAAAAFDGTRNLYVTRMLDGMLQKNDYGAVRDLLATGRYDGVLVNGQKEEYLNQASATENIVQHEAALSQAQTMQTARDGIKTVRAMIDNGDTPSGATIASAVDAAKAAGLPQSELVEAKYLGRTSVQLQGIRKLDMPVLDSRLRTLRQKMQSGTASDDERSWVSLAEKDAQRRNSDVGLKLAPLLKGTPDQHLAGIQQLAQLPVDQRFSAAHAAGEDKAAVVAGLSSDGQVFAVQGGAMRTARPADFEPPSMPGNPGRKQVDAITQSMLGNLVDDAGGHYAHLREAALDLMAGTARRWDEGEYRAALLRIYGRSRRTDGSYQGGIGTVAGRQVELPQQWSEAEFSKAYAGNPFTGAVYASGAAAQPDDIRQNFTLRHAGTAQDGSEQYVLIGRDSRELLHRDGKVLSPYLLSVSPTYSQRR